MSTQDQDAPKEPSKNERTTISELFKGKFRNTTAEHLGTTTLIFTAVKKMNLQEDDSAEATMRYLNQRKGR